MAIVVPSLPASSFEEIEELADSLRGTASERQIDIVDGKFVSAVSWPFTETNPKEALYKLRDLVSEFQIEIDCMVMEPEQYLDIFAELGIKRVIVHIGSTDKYDLVISHARKHGYKIGFAVTNDVPLEELEKYINDIDFVQVMGIKHVGSQGQPFDKRTLVTVSTLHDRYPELEIAVDGSVNSDTIPTLLEAGATRLAPGSAITKQKNPKKAFERLSKMVAQ